MARSEEPLESSLSSRWFIPGGVQRARPKKIEALSREGEREEEGAPEEETHTHTRAQTQTEEAERGGGQRSFGGALPRGQEGREEGEGREKRFILGGGSSARAKGRGR